MIISSVQKYFQNNKCWLIGNFEPSVFKTDKLEFGIHQHKKNEPTIPHFHLLTTEINVIMDGAVKVGDSVLMNGGIFIYQPSEISQVEFLEDTTLLVIRDGSFKGDKYEL
jgi:hypothetical protein